MISLQKKNLKEHSNKEGKVIKMSKKSKVMMGVWMALVFVVTFSMVVYAADDPITVVNNLSDFIFGLVRAVGMILVGFGIVQLGLSLKSHDPSQRANGIMTVAGGIVIMFAKEILGLITGGGD